MGLDSQSYSPQLPAPTDFTNYAPSDVGTNLSTRTDKTSFSIPDDGGEVHIRRPKGTNMSQASLLIEYYEGGKPSKSGHNTRPSVRVKVRPSSKSGMTNLNDAVKITKMGRDDQPVLVKRIPLDGTDQNVQLSGIGALSRKEAKHDPEAQAVAGSELTHSSGSHLSGRQPLEIEIMKNSSDMSSGYRIHNASDVSSMPAESTLDAPLTFKAPQRRRSRSLEREPGMQHDLLKAPVDERSRSLSREREHIAQRVIDKLKSEERDVASRRKLQKVRDKGGRELVDADLKARNRRSTSKSHNDSDLRSPDGSSLRTREGGSNLSGVSRSSTNNPKVLQAVEDAIRRLILPEIETLKRNQSLHQRRNRDSLTSGSSGRTDPSLRASKVTEDSIRHKERRRASRTGSERSIDTIEREKRQARENNSKHSTHSRGLGLDGLTAEALRTHNTSDAEKESRERRMRRSRHESRTNSIANTDQEYYEPPDKIPPMPLKSELMGSELTRESILSAETADSDGGRTERPEYALASPLYEVSRGNPITIQQEPRSAAKSPNALSPPYSRPSTRLTAIRASSPTPTPRKLRVSSSESVRTEASIRTKAKKAGLAAAGLGGAAMAALYQHDRGQDVDERTRSRQSHRSGRTVSREELPSRSISHHEESTSPLLEKSSPHIYANEHDLVVENDEAFARAEEDQPIMPSPHLSKEEENLGTANNQDSFYEEQHRVNDEYRSMTDYDSPQQSSAFDTLNSSGERELQGVAANPHIVSGPVEVESAVASLLDPSMVSTEASSTRRPGHYARVDSDSPSIRSEDSPTRRMVALPTQHDNNSRERWAMLRETARAVSIGGSRETSPDKPRTPIQPETYTVEASPAESTPKPLLFRGASDDSIPQTQPEPITHTQSWPISSDPQALQQLQDRDQKHFESPDVTPGTQLHHELSSSIRSEESMQDFMIPYNGAQEQKHYPQQSRKDFTTAANRRDPQYTIQQGNPTNDYSPLSFSKGPPRLFDDVDLTRPSPDFMLSPGKTMNNVPRVQHREHNREYSGNSYGVSDPMFDAATGTGMNHIASQDIVALMDHLSARDGQRSARDTEILVTLVRSASEMRDSIEGMKKFIEQQNHINMQRTDMDADKVVNKILSGPRPPPAPISSAKRQTTGSVDVSESPTKKANIFRRALKGLGGKSANDLTHIEDMLMQLLDEVEALRDDRGMPQSTPWPAKSQKPGSLESYEHLRVAPTYQTDFDVHGKPLTLSKPNQSQHAFISAPMNLAHPQSQSGTDRSPKKFDNADEEVSEGDQTPTQERPNPLNSHRVQQDYGYPPISIPAIPIEDKRQKHASTASSFVPVVSRWSKTTASTSYDNRNSLGMHFPSKSEDSQSGSEREVLPQHGYIVADDDRLPRSPSPLLPDNKLNSISPTLHPKYHANRNSLDLEHPQPRQGSTGRHQSNLETQATSFRPPEHSPLLNQSDVFGSHPSLGRLSAQYGVPTAINPNATAPPAPATLGRFNNINIDSPPHTYKSPVNNGNQDPLMPGAFPITPGLHPSDRPQYASSSESPQPASNPTTNSAPSSPASSRHEQGQSWQDTRLPTPQRVGRYQPGELLNPIEERYSMEGDRSSLYHRDSVKSRRGGGHSNRGSVHESVGDRRASAAGMADVQEEEEGNESSEWERQQWHDQQQKLQQHQHQLQTRPNEDPNRSLTSTPKISPRPALRAVAEPGGIRKLTGPREMPGSPASSGSSPKVATTRLAGAREANVPLRGTVRRKPVG